MTGAPIDDFDGLSPNQMHDLLYARPESSLGVQFVQSGIKGEDAPLMVLFNALMEAAGDKGLKATDKGNFPRTFCRQAYDLYSAKATHDPLIHFFRVNREADFEALHVTRIVAEMAGLIRKYKGRYVLTRKTRQLHEKDGIYPHLLTTYATEFNWGYRDGHPEIGFIQQGFGYTLYQLSRHGANTHTTDYYTDAFLRAFPALLHEMEPSEHTRDPEQTLRQCYALRSLQRFAGFLGLAQLDWHGQEPFDAVADITKTPLLDAAVQFNFTGTERVEPDPQVRTQ